MPFRVFLGHKLTAAFSGWFKPLVLLRLITLFILNSMEIVRWLKRKLLLFIIINFFYIGSHINIFYKIFILQ